MKATPGQVCGNCKFFRLLGWSWVIETMGSCDSPNIEWVSPNAAGIVYSDSDDPNTCESFELKEGIS